MCRSRRDTMASDPKLTPSPRDSRSSETLKSPTLVSFPTDTTTTPVSTSSSFASLVSVRDAPVLYPFLEISSATNNFLSARLSSSAAAWRCSLRGTQAVVFRAAFRGDPEALPKRLAVLCRSHHTSVARLLGASLAGDGCIYLAHEYVAGTSLADCLRNPRNPGFTPLSSWTSRMQVATDLAQGLEYIHHHSPSSLSSQPALSNRRRQGSVHNRIKSTAIIITEPGFRAKICYFGATEVAGEATAHNSDEELDEKNSSGSRAKASVRIEGTRGYIAPEVLAGCPISQRSDVFAFGVVLLELLSGEEPLRYRWDTARRNYERVSLMETAREAYGAGDEDDGVAAVVEARRGRIRRWMDRRLRDSFPEEVVDKLIRVALRCVEAEARLRPDMVWVAGKVSRLFLHSMAWEESIGILSSTSVSLAPR